MEKLKNRKGRNSLIICVVGLIIVQTLIYFNYLNKYWYIVLAGFEAGTIGGIADWFAVKALFREIPIPFVRKHTNIVVKNRDKISNGIVDLVTNQWLSPKVIKEKIGEVSLTDKIISSLKSNSSSQFNPFIKEIFNYLITSLNTKKTQDFLVSVFKNQFENFNVGVYAGNYLKDSIGKKEYHQLWEVVLGATANAINSEETKTVLASTIQIQIESYKGESFFKNVAVSLGQGSNAIDKESIAEKLLNSFNEIITEAKDTPTSSLRKKFDDYLTDFAQKLIDEDKKTIDFINNIKNRISGNKDIYEIIEVFLSNLNKLSNTNLDDENSIVSKFIKEKSTTIIQEFSNNEELKFKIDSWLNSVIEKLISDNHKQIGGVVASSLQKLDNEELVNQIEGKVGDDLQYIRLNGAIVGGFVGVVIAILRMVFGLV